MSQRAITQKELARRLNVSIATVSRALNDQPGVSPDVRQQILRLAKELGYSPDIRARSLATSFTHTVAFVVHDDHAAVEDPFYPVIMAGAEAYLSQHNYHTLLTTVDEQVMARPRDFSVVNQKRVDGLILAGPDISASFILSLVATEIPLVLVDNCLLQTAVNCVLNDDEGGAYAATRCLLDHGHRRIVFLSGPQEWVSSRDRMRGYQRAVEEASLEALILHGTETTIDSGRDLMDQALERWPDLTAVCAVNDAVAIGAIRTAARAGRRIPEHLSAMGFDDIGWAAMNEPPLSTVHVFKHRMGELAAQRLLDDIRNPDAPAAKTIVSTELVLRDSCCNRV
ncbi:MAG: LacI family DNA-binding transcriptional regulator [Anaerolineae bacterium]|jgi:DNA-binding LacI/PurR family transcriptional regulator